MAKRRSKSKEGVSKHNKDLYTNLLHKFGEQGMYEKVVGLGMMRAATNKDYDVDLLNLSEMFQVELFRSGNEEYEIIRRVLRRAAHTIFRQIYKNSPKKADSRFLILVKR